MEIVSLHLINLQTLYIFINTSLNEWLLIVRTGRYVRLKAGLGCDRFKKTGSSPTIKDDPARGPASTLNHNAIIVRSMFGWVGFQGCLLCFRSDGFFSSRLCRLSYIRCFSGSGSQEQVPSPKGYKFEGSQVRRAAGPKSIVGSQKIPCEF